MKCSLCEGDKNSLPYETPNDPPFYPSEDGLRHCEACEYWLLFGDIPVSEAEAKKANDAHWKKVDMDELLQRLEMALLKAEDELKICIESGRGIPPENVPYFLEIITTFSKTVGSMIRIDDGD